MELSNRQWSLLSAFLVLAALAVLYVFVISPVRDRSVFSPEGMRIDSTTVLSPVDQLKEYRLAKTVVISPGIGVNGTGDGALTNAANMPIILASANDQNAIQLIRELDASGQIVDCLTNFGNPKTLVTLDATECAAILEGDTNTLVIRIDGANAGMTEDLARLSEHGIDFSIVHRANADRMVFGVLRGVYSNADQVLANANQFVSNNKNTIGSIKK